MRSFYNVAVFALAGCLTLCGCGAGSRTTDKARFNGIAARYLADDIEGCVSDLSEYLKQYPKDEQAWTLLSIAHSDLEQLDEALQAYDRALALDPGCVKALTAKGIVHRKRGEYDKALAAYRSALKVNPNHAEAYTSMALVALLQYRDREALKYAKKAYDLDREEPDIAANLAIMYHYNGDSAKRDEMTAIADGLGYRDVDTLHQIYSGELSVRD